MLTHVDQNNNPTMVDVTDKTISIRMAKAQTTVVLPPELKPFFVGQELILKKGPVFQTAIIAGTMAVKRTHEMIPFCHQLPVESCKFEISVQDLLVTITCQVKTTFKTGVEMEALHGAMVAALTIYDMCKAVSHNIIIQETKLLAKTGGKRTILGRPTYGLVLTGGKSSRMGKPKALIDYHGKPHAEHIHQILTKYCDHVFLSSKENQWVGSSLENFPTINDHLDGPIGGMLSAFEKYPDVNWVVVACDLVHFNEKTVEKLLANVSEEVATCYKNNEKDFPEPLCTFYTPGARIIFKVAYESKITCPVKVLGLSKVHLILQEDGIDLSNINTPEELHAVH
jgi:cyclic pyranopterin phosphate synthase